MKSLIAVSALALVFFQASWARADEAAAAAKPDAPESVAGDAKVQSAPGGDQWRFKYHQGRWWYWLPSEKWVYWNDGKWVGYDQATYAKLQAATRARTPAYSYSGGRGGYNYPDGYWGPVRYNQYGQPQYPYSQRTSGIRQLGPVPAMGGVRSLPGWGGER